MKHFVLVLFAGDYEEAGKRRLAGLPDRYRHHSYALESLETLLAAGVRVSVVQLQSSAVYDRQGHQGIRFLGLGPGSEPDAARALAAYLRAEAATHVMIRFPSVPVLQEIVNTPARVSVVLADSFPAPLRHRARYRELSAALVHPRVDFVANHHLNSSRQLTRVLGLEPGRVVPWDWPLDLVDVARSSARRHPAATALRLFYAGSISGSKGVWDVVAALKALRRRGLDASLDVAGAGDVEGMQARVARAGLEEHVRHHGRVGGDEILRLMRESAFVCVPSRHSYPEGLPLTIYEAMASGTPLMASDHPMFRGVVRHGETGFVFRAGRPASLANAVVRAWEDPAAYERVSATAAAAYERLGLPTLWGDVVVSWVTGDADDRAWLRSHALA